jgi:hypothetical protein
MVASSSTTSRSKYRGLDKQTRTDRKTGTPPSSTPVTSARDSSRLFEFALTRRPRCVIDVSSSFLPAFTTHQSTACIMAIMLSSIGQAAIRRVASTAVATSSRRFHVVVSRLAVPRVAFRRLQSNPVWARGYAVKAAATKTKTKTAGRSTATKKKTPAKKTSKTSKTTGRKRVAAKKVAAKKKKVAAKKPIKKKLTPEQRTERKAKLEKQTLKKDALFQEPARLPGVAWPLYMQQRLTGTKVSSRQEVNDKVISLVSEYKTLPSSELQVSPLYLLSCDFANGNLQQLQNTAEQNKRANATAYKAWVEAHTTDQIQAANRARRLLHNKYNFPKDKALKLIKDERQPKRILTPFAHFTKSRWSSGEFANVPLPEAAKDITAQWKNLAPGEKQVSCHALP